MATPNSRATLIDYCKRRLGDPVIEINGLDISQYAIDNSKEEIKQYLNKLILFS